MSLTLYIEEPILQNYNKFIADNHFIYIYIFYAEAEEPTEFLVHPNELEENQSISLTCNADVGRRHGNIQIWKILNALDLIYTSYSPKTENCTENVYANDTLILPVTRDDNGATFRCSSQNDFTKEPGPSRYSSKITVICMYSNIYKLYVLYVLRRNLTAENRLNTVSHR